jgi:hypothetical protein
MDILNKNIYRLAQLIKNNFNIEIIKIEIISDNTDSKAYFIESATDMYALKEMGSDAKLENHGELIKHLIGKGINVPKIYYTLTGCHFFIDNGLQYILYEYIEGTMIELNTALGWFLVKSARTLGQIQNALNDYRQMPLDVAGVFACLL